MAYDTYQQVASFLAKFGLFHPLTGKYATSNYAKSRKENNYEGSFVLKMKPANRHERGRPRSESRCERADEQPDNRQLSTINSCELPAVSYKFATRGTLSDRAKRADMRRRSAHV